MTIVGKRSGQSWQVNWSERQKSRSALDALAECNLKRDIQSSLASQNVSKCLKMSAKCQIGDRFLSLRRKFKIFSPSCRQLFPGRELVLTQPARINCVRNFEKRFLRGD